MNDAFSNVRGAIRSSGLEPPDVIEPGKLHRFPGVGKRSGNTTGGCELFDDGRGGCFGDWALGFFENWQAKRDKPFSPSERRAFTRHIEETRKRAEKDRQQRYVDATERAASVWNEARPANEDHPYLVCKGNKANGSRPHQGALVISVRSGGAICSLLFIAEDGGKRFLSGGWTTGRYLGVDPIKGSKALCIAEGFATRAHYILTPCPWRSGGLHHG